MAELNSIDIADKRYPVGSENWLCVRIVRWVYPARRLLLVPFVVRQAVGNWLITKLVRVYLFRKHGVWL